MRTRSSLPSTFTLLALLLLPSLALAQKITTDYDHSANFSDYHTYAWTPGTPVKDQLMDQRIHDNIDQQLASKGYQKIADSAQADVLVAYDAAVGKQTQLNTMGMGGWGRGWGMGGQMATTTVDSIPVGALAVRIGDNKTHKIVWRGTASGTLKDNPQKIAQQIQKSTAKIFAKYPPKPEK
jgi:hypothetical protein